MENIERYLIRNAEEMNKLQEEWEKLQAGREMTVFQSFAWNALLAEEEKKRTLSSLFCEIWIYVVRQNDEAVMLLPIIYQKHGNRTKWFGRERGLYILGHSSWSDYLNAVYGEKADRDAIIRLIRRIQEDYPGCTLYATDIREETRFNESLKEMQAEVIGRRKAVQVDIAESREAYEQGLSKHVKQNLRTALNRMKRDNFSYRLEETGRTENEALIRELTELHIERMKEKNSDGKDPIHRISSAIRKKYLTRRERKNNIITESMRRMEQSCLVTVRLNEDIAGYLYGLHDRDAIRIMQNCVKTKYRFYSPMFRGAYDLILHQYDQKKPKHIDFTRGNEQYKYDLGGKASILVSYAVKTGDQKQKKVE